MQTLLGLAFMGPRLLGDERVVEMSNEVWHEYINNHTPPDQMMIFM